jgi:hypothetical protein
MSELLYLLSFFDFREQCDDVIVYPFISKAPK